MVPGVAVAYHPFTPVAVQADRVKEPTALKLSSRRITFTLVGLGWLSWVRNRYSPAESRVIKAIAAPANSPS